MTTGRLFLAPLLHALRGGDYKSALRWRRAPLLNEAPVSDREQFLCGRSDNGGVRILDRQRASSQALLADANLLVRVRLRDALPKSGTDIEWVEQ